MLHNPDIISKRQPYFDFESMTHTITRMLASSIRQLSYSSPIEVIAVPISYDSYDMNADSMVHT